MTALLEVTEVELAYGAVPACRDVTFHVEPGEIVTLLGANGAGKTTTLGAVAGLLVARSGTVRFEGRDVTRLAAQASRSCPRGG